MNRQRIGVIGSGYWGPNLIRNFVELPEADVVIVADLKADRRDRIKGFYPQVEVTEDYQTLFDRDLDAAVVATPPPTHFPLAKDCLEHNLHVLVEKPMTLTLADAEALNRIAAQKKRTLMVGHTFEYNSAVLALKELIDSGELGDVYYISTLRLNLGLFQRDLNVLWDLAPHDISIIRFLLGQDPVSVSAVGSAHILDGVPDIAFLCMNFPDNVMSHSRLSWLDPRKVRLVTVVGSKKMVVYDDVATQQKITIYDKGVALPYTESFGEFQLHYRYGDVVAPYIRFDEPLRMECQDFLEAIQNGNRPRSCGNTGQCVVKILEYAQRSMQNEGAKQVLM
jgi:predicted dehydrogenase